MNTMRFFRILGFAILLAGGVSVSNTTSAQPGVSINFDTFYDELSPYGRWVRNPQYGSVWVPEVPRGFQPYSTNGYWEVTEYGNTWVSDYDWGWAPFHYGRWAFDDYIGWFWVPDYEWGPAWVNWRSGGGYYGWAPLGPGMHVNVSVNIPSFWWVFVPQRYVTYRNWNNYCPPRRRVTQVYNQTVIINNYYRSNNRVYAYGPRRDEIERVTRRNVPVRTIDASPRGRGRVIVADGPSRNSSRGDDDRYSRPSSSRNGSVIDAGSDRRRPSTSYESRDNRSGRGNTGNDNSSRDASERLNRTPRSANEDRDNFRDNRSRVIEPSAPSDRGSERETPRQPERNSERFEAPRQPERRPERFEAPRQPERSEPSSRPSSGSERSRPSAPSNRGSYEAPQRQERSAPAPANNSRSGQEGGSRGASERSSRSPR